MTEITGASEVIRLTANLLAALAAQTRESAGAPTVLVSVVFDVLSDQPADEWTKTEVRIERVTKSLVFASAELRNGDDKRLISASAVHKIIR